MKRVDWYDMHVVDNPNIRAVDYHLVNVLGYRNMPSVLAHTATIMWFSTVFSLD